MKLEKPFEMIVYTFSYSSLALLWQVAVGFPEMQVGDNQKTLNYKLSIK